MNGILSHCTCTYRFVSLNLFIFQVKMEFADKTVAPGAETSIHLEAASGSVCGIGVVDKSVNILGGDHQITPKKVSSG